MIRVDIRNNSIVVKHNSFSYLVEIRLSHPYLADREQNANGKFSSVPTMKKKAFDSQSQASTRSLFGLKHYSYPA